jgi:2-polyprenyl-3-methyl-5-hydroxy-6-metoxy-1,4-benzoquinol methylase
LDKQTWAERTNNYLIRRNNGEFTKQKPEGNFNPPIVGNYASHLSKFHIGESVLDVGCGIKILKDLMPVGVEYHGADPFPADNDTIASMLEDLPIDKKYDTVICFAMLDTVFDIQKALSVLNVIAKQNICILTGVEIEVNMYHTYRLDMDMLIGGLPAFCLGYCEELIPKVFLLEFTRKQCTPE